MYGPTNCTSGNNYGMSQSQDGALLPSSKPYVTGSPNDILDLSSLKGGKKKSTGFRGAITDFGKGILKGAYEAVTGLFTVKGMLMAVGGLIAVAVIPAVAIPVLIAGGVAIGGTQIAKGLMSNDWEEAGKGTFTLGATVLGAKFGPKSIKGADDAEYALVKTSKKNGMTTASRPKGMFSATWANIKTLFGSKMGKLDKDGNIMTTADGKLVEGKNIYQLSNVFSPTPKSTNLEACSTTPYKDYSHLVRIGEGSNPSPEFVAKAQKSVTEMMNSLPEELRELALKQNFGVKIYHSPNDYINRLEPEGLEAILTKTDIQDLKTRLDDMRPTVKEQLQKMSPEQEISDEFLDEIMADNEEALKYQILEERQGCKAYYSRGYQNIILHEKLGTPNMEHIVIDPSTELFQHEIGHYFDWSRQVGSPSFSSDPQFRRLLQEDLENAHQNKNHNFSLTKNEKGQLRLSESERFNLQQTNIEQLKQQGISQTTIESIKQQNSHLLENANAEHFAYYAPIDELQVLNERKSAEAFAEIFAGLFGKGCFQKGCLAKDLYPKTAEYMRSNILPEIGTLPAIQKGHNGF
jgi:hypothetical protein